MSTVPPSTADCLRFHACHTPRAVALISRRQAIEYSAFHRDLRKFTAALRGFGLPRRSGVAVACEDTYVHWLLLLACENLGLATISVLHTETSGLAPVLPQIQLMLSTHDMPEAQGLTRHRITSEWLKGVLAMPDRDVGSPADDAPRGLDDPLRLRRSSGTTGVPKLMSSTRRLVEARIQSNYPVLGLTPRSRLLLSAHFTVQFMYTYATICLRMGGTCVDRENDMAQAIVAHRPTHLRLFQFQVRPILDKLPEGFRKPADLTVLLGSAPLSEALRKEVLGRLATRLVYQYGTNETGTLAAIDDDGIATLYPGIEAEIVDARGQPVAAGHEGRLRVKTPLIVDGYLGDPGGAAGAFRDGWFHTGDAATMLPSGQLRIAGRSDDILNIGGIKFAPSQIEEIALQTAPIEDIGVTTLPNADGIEEAYVAMVLRDRSKLSEAGAAIRQRFPESFGRMHFIAVDRIPRTEETGKVRRADLKRVLRPK